MNDKITNEEEFEAAEREIEAAQVEDKPTVFLSSETYDKLKFLTQIGLPALGAFYVAIAGLWNLPYPNEVSGTVLAVVTLLGVLLGVSSKRFKEAEAVYDGTMFVGEDRNRLELDHDLESLEKKDVLKLKVTPELGEGE